MIDDIVSFKTTITRERYSSEEFKVYATKADIVEYPNVERDSYGYTILTGNMPTLSVGVEYEIVGKEKDSKYGKQYSVMSFHRVVPATEEDVRAFLSEILSMSQVDVIMANYPDIITIVREGRINEVDVSRLKGIKEKTLNKIANKITENFCLFDLVKEFRNCLDLSTIRKIYNEYGSVEKTKDELKKNPYECLCSLARIGFRTADTILLNMEKKMNECLKKGESVPIRFNNLIGSKERCLACIMYILQQNESDGNTKMDLVELRKHVISMVNECSDKFSDAMLDEKIYYNVDAMEVSLASTRQIEECIAERICYALNNSIKYEGIDIERYRNIAECELSDEQICAIKNVCEYNVSILNGCAGTGKSFSTQAVIQMLDDNGKSYIIMSPTGKAAKVIAEYTNRRAFTIHRGLGYNPKNGWLHNSDNPLPHDVVIVDEFSMTDVRLFSRLLDAIDLNHTKLLIIGDNSQLPSVQCGNLLHDFMQSNVIPTTTLTKVFRYSDGGLMKIATDVRMCKKYLTAEMKNKCTAFGESADYYFVDVQDEKIIPNLKGLYLKLLNDGIKPEDIQVLSAKNVGNLGTIRLNQEIQKIANNNYYSDRFIDIGNDRYYVGDIVIQRKNNYSAKLNENFGIEDDMFNQADYDVDYHDDEDDNSNMLTAFVANGETGKIIDIEDTDVIIDFDGIVVRYSKNDMLDVSLGYVISIHKSQGSSSPYVIIVSPKSHTFMINSNLLYVGLTRMKKKCYHIGCMSTVNNAVSKKENFKRNTFMQQLLLEQTGTE